VSYFICAVRVLRVNSWGEAANEVRVRSGRRRRALGMERG